MVRTYKKKVDRKPTTPRKIQAAINHVKAGWSLRKAAEYNRVPRETLRSLWKKRQGVPESEEGKLNLNLSYSSRNVFPSELDSEMAEYCIAMAQTGYGLSVRRARELAYEVADKNKDKVNVPPNWERDKMAGIDWFQGFLKRHPEISIRTPEGCSIARAMAFNEVNVNIFFDKLAEVRERHESFKDGSRVFNLDETSTSTVQNVRKVLSPKGVKQIHQIKGQERGVSVTTCIIIGAFGSVLPLVHIFPRKKYVPDLLINAYPGALGLGNANGYMTKESFLQVMQHFIKCTNSTKENPTLLLLDNVESHFSTSTLDLAKENGVVVFTFPPHCTHKLQPLDVGFFGPFKTFYDQAITTFLANNPACPPSIYRVAGFVRDALFKAASPQTIIKSFQKPGIIPFDRNVFSEIDYAMASVTAKPNPSASPPNTAEGGDSLVNEVETPSSPPAAGGTSHDSSTAESVSDAVPTASNDKQDEKKEERSFIGPMSIRGLPKAMPKEVTRKPRRKGKCKIATDTPEKEEIRQREEAQAQHKQEAEERKQKRAQKAVEKEALKKEKGKKRKLRSKNSKKSPVAKQLNFESDSSEEVDEPSDVTNKSFPSRSQIFPPLQQEPVEGDHVLVSFEAGKETVFYVGKVIGEKDRDGDLEISFFRKKTIRNESVCFTLPNVPELNSVNISDIKCLLPKPQCHAATTRRQQDILSFDFEFSCIRLG